MCRNHPSKVVGGTEQAADPEPQPYPPMNVFALSGVVADYSSSDEGSVPDDDDDGERQVGCLIQHMRCC